LLSCDDSELGRHSSSDRFDRSRRHGYDAQRWIHRYRSRNDRSVRDVKPVMHLWVIKMPSRIKIRRLERYHSTCYLRGAPA